MVTDTPIKEELYGLEYDSGEKLNISSKENVLCNQLKGDINKALIGAISNITDKNDSKVELDNKAKKQLKALGYIQ